MNSYVIRFTIANIVLTVVLAILAEAMRLKSGSSFAVAAAIASSFFAAAAFAKDHSRAPTSAEKATFAWRALLTTWLASLLLAALVLTIFSDGSEIRATATFLTSGSTLALVVGTFLFVSAVYYVAIRWSFGWYARLAAERR
jgi:hypothetical protein